MQSHGAVIVYIPRIVHHATGFIRTNLDLQATIVHRTHVRQNRRWWMEEDVGDDARRTMYAAVIQVNCLANFLFYLVVPMVSAHVIIIWRPIQDLPADVYWIHVKLRKSFGAPINNWTPVPTKMGTGVIWSSLWYSIKGFSLCVMYFDIVQRKGSGDM